MVATSQTQFPKQEDLTISDIFTRTAYIAFISIVINDRDSNIQCFDDSYDVVL